MPIFGYGPVAFMDFYKKENCQLTDQLANHQPNIDFGIVHHFPTKGNPVYIKQMHLEAKHCVDTHKHKFDHFGLLGKGSALVELDGQRTVYQAPCVIEIKADKIHKITAITDITWFCIHHTEETDPLKVDEVLIK